MGVEPNLRSVRVPIFLFVGTAEVSGLPASFATIYQAVLHANQEAVMNVAELLHRPHFSLLLNLNVQEQSAVEGGVS